MLRAIALHAGLVLAALAGVNSSQESRWLRERVAKMTSVQGAYENEHYGFRTPVLPGVKAYRAVAPAPNHGVLYILGEQRTIAVSAELDAADYGSTRAFLDHIAAAIASPPTERKPMTLDGMKAEQAIFRTSDSILKVIALRRDERGGVLYELALTTTLRNQSDDFPLFDKVVAGFKLEPLPP